jgi:hypothetical protein
MAQRGARRRNLVYLDFWSDPFITLALTCQQAFFYLRLITAWPEAQAGIVTVSREALYALFRPREFSLGDVNQAMEVLEEAGKIIYDAETLWLVNYLKWHGGQEGGRPEWLQASIVQALQECHSKSIYDGFLYKYGQHPLLTRAMIPPYRHASEGTPSWFIPGTPPPRRAPITPEGLVPSDHLPEVVAEIERVWEAYVEIMNSTMTLTAGRREKIVARLADKIIDPATKKMRSATSDDLITAIRACRASPWNMGENEERQVKNHPETYIFKSQEQLEGWLQKATQSPAPTPMADQGLISRSSERMLQKARALGDEPPVFPWTRREGPR